MTRLNDGSLSQGEIEVLRMIAHDHSNAEIAEALVIAPVTVASRIYSIRQRLGLEDAGRVGLARWYWEHYERSQP